jgi:hypothetical protein
VLQLWQEWPLCSWVQPAEAGPGSRWTEARPGPQRAKARLGPRRSEARPGPRRAGRGRRRGGGSVLGTPLQSRDQE